MARFPVILIAALAFGFAPRPAPAAEQPAVELKAEGGAFHPAEVEVPAKTPFTLHVTNAEKHSVEFESEELHRERVVKPGKTAAVNMQALAPGRYPFFDDFHKSVKGTIVAK
jgi:plastocyanin